MFQAVHFACSVDNDKEVCSALFQSSAFVLIAAPVLCRPSYLHATPHHASCISAAPQHGIHTMVLLPNILMMGMGVFPLEIICKVTLSVRKTLQKKPGYLFLNILISLGDQGDE